MSNILIETNLFQPTKGLISEGKTSSRGLPLVEGILATAEVKNGNGRYYPKALWKREIDKYMSSVKENRALGELRSSRNYCNQFKKCISQHYRHMVGWRSYNG